MRRWLRGRMILMYRPSPREHTVGRFLRRLLLIDLVIFALVGGVCLLNAPWRNVHSFSEGLLLVTGFMVAGGVMFMYGNWMQTGDFGYQYGLSAGVDDLPTRTARTVNDRRAGVRGGLQIMLYALLPLLAGVLLNTVG